MASELENKTTANELAYVLFDGVCNYCNRRINFLIRNDKRKKFRFAPLQSKAARQLLKEYEIKSELDSVILIYNGKVYLKSSAALLSLYLLGGLFTLPFILIIVPAYIRDFYYDIIARNRYKWWGKRDQCMVPSEDVEGRFLD